MLAATILEVLIYAIVGNNCMWWCLSKEYGFWSKLFRLIPFAVFVVLQIGQIFMFKGVLEEMMGKSLSMKLLSSVCAYVSRSVCAICRSRHLRRFR